MENITKPDVKGKKVLVRVDYNVPLKDGKILDDTRIMGSLETIDYLVKKGARIILMSHLGRVKEESDKKNNSLKLVAKRLTELVHTPVFFVPSTRGEILEEIYKMVKSF